MARIVAENYQSQGWRAGSKQGQNLPQQSRPRRSSRETQADVTMTALTAPTSTTDFERQIAGQFSRLPDGLVPDDKTECCLQCRVIWSMKPLFPAYRDCSTIDPTQAGAIRPPSGDDRVQHNAHERHRPSTRLLERSLFRLRRSDRRDKQTCRNHANSSDVKPRQQS